MTDSQSSSKQSLEMENSHDDISSASIGTTPEKRPATVVAVALFILSIVTLIILFYQNQKLSKEIILLKKSVTPVAMEMTHTPNIKPEPTIPISNLKTYRGTKYTFQYPDYWITDECSNSICLHSPDNTIALVLSVDSPELKADYFAQCEKVAKTESLMVQGLKITKTTLVGIDSDLCGVLTPNTHAMYKIESKNSKLEDLLDIRYNSGDSDTVDKILSTFKLSSSQTSLTSNIYSNSTLGIEFNYLPTYKIDSISEPQKFEGIAEKIWSISLKSQNDEYINIHNMTPPDGGECTEVLSTKKVKGVYIFDFVKIGQSKETYCAGGPGGISWYGVTGLNDPNNKVLYIESATKDTSEANLVSVEEAMLKVITSIKYIK